MTETFIAFEYNSNGYHNGGLRLSGEAELQNYFQTIVKKAKEEKRKVIITDVMDDCVFHLEDGNVIWPKE